MRATISRESIIVRYLSSYRGLPKAVYYLFVARLVNAMGFFVYPLLTLILTQKVGMSISQAGLYVSLVTITQAPCLLIGGKLADHMGRRRLAVMAGLGSGLFFLVCGFLGAGHSLIWFLMIASDLDVIGIPACEALLADHTGEEQRQRSYSLMYLGTNLGMTISPIIAGFLFNDYLYLVFILDAATTILCNLIIWRKVPESHPRKPAIRAGEEAADEVLEGTTGRQSLAGVLRRLPILVAFVFLLFILDFCYIQWQFTLPAECGVLFGASSAQRYSLMTSENALVCILLTPLLTGATSRIRPLVSVGLGCIAYTISYLGLAFAQTFPAFLVFGAIFTTGEVLCAVQTGAFIANHSPRVFRGRINAFVYFVRGSSQALSPVIMGLVLAASTYRVSWLVGMVLAGLATIGMFMLERKERGVPTVKD